ncbi:methyltransferase domain-containing protein [bacterium]|nr:methyltransferase domain-containing protein [bacterium]
MAKPSLDVAAHYEYLAEAFADPDRPKMVDPFHDPPKVAAWLAQADGPEFWDTVGDVTGKAVLEVGIGTGRVARKMLDRGCATVTGLDVSPRTLALARANLCDDRRVDYVLQDVVDFVRPDAFDLAYSVWTFFHVQDKQRALSNIVTSLKSSGRLVLSLEQTPECLDHGTHLVQQYPVEAARYIAWLRDLDCEVVQPVPVPDREQECNALLTTIVSATKR